MIGLQRVSLDLVSLLFPELCNGCGESLYHGEKDICIKCLIDLPYTDYHLFKDNRVAKQLWSRLPVNAATAMLYFKKGTKVQNLMHSLKYKGKIEVGVKLGRILGERLKASPHFNEIDLIIPVPLHAKRRKIRGYNQSEHIAIGIAEALGATLGTQHLVREKITATQTRKSRYIRFENMRTVFKVINPEQIENLHVLLIDDVITTGATLEACGNELLGSKIKKLSIAALAFAE